MRMLKKTAARRASLIPMPIALIAWSLGSEDRRAFHVESSYESSAAEAFGNLPSSPAYLSPAFLKAEPSSMNFRC
jgi:hypothetical protein